MGNVIELKTGTNARIPPETILQAALAAELTEAIIVGQRPDGTVYFAMSSADVPNVNWMLDCAKRLLMDGIVDEEVQDG